jgi:hypothetical protein
MSLTSAELKAIRRALAVSRAGRIALFGRSAVIRCSAAVLVGAGMVLAAVTGRNGLHLPLGHLSELSSATAAFISDSRLSAISAALVVIGLVLFSIWPLAKLFLNREVPVLTLGELSPHLGIASRAHLPRTPVIRFKDLVGLLDLERQKGHKR